MIREILRKRSFSYLEVVRIRSFYMFWSMIINEGKRPKQLWKHSCCIDISVSHPRNKWFLTLHSFRIAQILLYRNLSSYLTSDM